MKTSNIWKAFPTSPDNILLLFKVYVVTSYLDIYTLTIKIQTFSGIGLKANNWCIIQEHRVRCWVSLDVHGKPQKFQFSVCSAKHPKLRCTPMIYLNYFSLACWLENSIREGNTPWSHWLGWKDKEMKAPRTAMSFCSRTWKHKGAAQSVFPFQISWPVLSWKLLKIG